MKKELKKLLKRLEKEIKTISFGGEYKISEQINKLFTDSETCTNEEIAERIAFDFVPDYKSQLDWGTYYGPKFILPDQHDKGKVRIYPHISQINEQIIEYWEKRAKRTLNPIFKSRYADLVVDFKPKILNQRADQKYYDIVIEANITICKNRLSDDLSCQTRLRRALNLELETKKKVSEELIDVIITLDARGEFDKPGTWGFAFDWLVLSKNKKIKIDEIIKKRLLDEILAKFNKATSEPNILEYTCSLLAEYYAKQNDEENLLKILLTFEERYKKSFENQDALSRSHAYHRVLEVFSIYSKFKKVREQIDRILREIGSLKLDWGNALQKLSTETEIPKNRIDEHLDFVFGKNRDENIEKVVSKIVYLNLPKKDSLRKLYIELSSKYVFQRIVTQQIIGGDGLIKAVLAPEFNELNEGDDDPKFLFEAQRYMQFGLFALNIDFSEFKKNFAKEQLLRYLEGKLLCKHINSSVLKTIIDAYYKEDYIVFSYITSPIIESIVREFIKINNGSWIRRNTYGGFVTMTLHEMISDNLNQNIFKQVFGEVAGENILFYLKLALVEKLGMEIRTDVAHGKNIDRFFDKNIANILLHILLIFSLVIKKRSK